MSSTTPTKSTATRADVARLAGVSESTVSYALSGVRSIAPETRERILAAMAELDYTPNVMAQGLAGKKTSLVALLFPVSDRGVRPSDYEYVSAASQVFEEAGYQLLIWPNPVEDLDAVKRIATQHLVDGVIMMEVRVKDPRPKIFRDARVPYVLIGHTDDPVDSTWVDADFSEWGPLAIDRLVALGHRNIALVTQPEEYYAAGYGPLVRTEENLNEYAASRKVKLSIHRIGSNIAAGREVFAEVMRKRPDVTAFVGFNEFGMIGLLEAISAAGKSIPQDFSVIQFGGRSTSADVTSPPQDTIGVDGVLLGEKAAEFLLKRLRNESDEPLTFMAEPEYFSRGSIGPAAR